jgi:hypothetical protein
MLNDCKPIKGMTLNRTKALRTNSNESNILPASERLKTVNLTKSSTKSDTNSYQKQASYALDSVGASTEEVCWLPGVNTVSTTGEQVLKLIETKKKKRYLALHSGSTLSQSELRCFAANCKLKVIPLLYKIKSGNRNA